MVDPFRDLCKHTGNQRGPYLVIWAMQSRLRGEGGNVFLVGGSAGSSVKLSFRAGARKGVGKSCPPWPLGFSLSALPFVCYITRLLSPVRGGPLLPACGFCHPWGPDRPRRWALEGGLGDIRPWAPPPRLSKTPQLWIAQGCQAPWKQVMKRKPLLPASLHSPPSSPLQGK